ncbi:MAG: TlyA family RNA methyltransferase [Alphaproteobacteria bacterium]|nr:TlyA family RNA methyltransferase [Alphaproteobacteria bacterium]
MRLDLLMVERGLAPSRARAQAEIKAGRVLVRGVTAAKPAQEFDANTEITLEDPAIPYVSRAGLKLAHALDQFGIPSKDKTVLDVGASTGGFTDVVLTRGAARVFAVDVGRDQLSPKFLSDARVVSLEGQDARSLTPEQIPVPVDLIVCDVSFISATKVLPHACSFAADTARLVVLVKPQFEVGRGAIGKGGIVKDSAAREKSIETVSAAVEAMSGWTVTGCVESPIAGGSGNIEFLLGARKDG